MTIKKASIYCVLFLFPYLIFFSCKKKNGCTDSQACNYDNLATVDDGSCVYCSTSGRISFNFTHYYNMAPVSAADFDQLQYINAFGNTHGISRLRYLISDIALHNVDGDSIIVNGYNLVDLTNTNGLTYSPLDKFEYDDYTAISFTWGLDETDNVSGAYTELNASSWSWPEMLGGGYHFMQLEGKYIDVLSDTLSYGCHYGTAREILLPDTIYHPNHFRVKLTSLTPFTVDSTTNSSIEIKMNIAEWFSNPNTWDFNQYSTMLMTNYAAQVMMNDNGRSVFDFSVTH